MVSIRQEVQASATTLDSFQIDGTGELAQSTYRELRNRGLSDTDIMAFAGELLTLVASEYRNPSAAE